MADIQDLRAQLRQEKSHPVATREGFRIPFGVVAAAAVILGFLVVTFTPKLYSVQRTATLPDFKEVRPRAETREPAAVQAADPSVAHPATPQPAAAPPPMPAGYAGKSAEEIARIADGICTQRVEEARRKMKPEDIRPQLGQPPGIPQRNDRLHCFLSEAPARFCSRSQRTKAAADVINYFKGIEYSNAALGVAQKVLDGGPRHPFNDPTEAAERAAQHSSQLLRADPRILEAVEALMRAGYLMKSHREDIAGNVPRPVKERFARVIGNRLPCPDPPWWAVWR